MNGNRYGHTRKTGQTGLRQHKLLNINGLHTNHHIKDALPDCKQADVAVPNGPFGLAKEAFLTYGKAFSVFR